MLSMRVSTILTAACKGRQQAVGRADGNSESGRAVVPAKQDLERCVGHPLWPTAADQTYSKSWAGPLNKLLLTKQPLPDCPIACTCENVRLRCPSAAELELFGTARCYDHNTFLSSLWNTAHATQVVSFRHNLP